MDVLIVGAGGLARQVVTIMSKDKNLKTVGYVDIDDTRKGEMILNHPIIGDHSVIPSLYKKGVHAAFIAVGDNFIRENHFYKLENMGFELINVLDPSANLALDIELKENTIIGPGVIISTGVVLGSNIVIEAGTVIGPNSEIGNNTYLGQNVSIGGNVKIERNSCIGLGSTIAPFKVIGKNALVKPGGVVLEDIESSFRSESEQD